MLHELPGKRPSASLLENVFSEKKSSHVVCPVCVDLCSANHLADAFRSFCRVSFSPFLCPSFFSVLSFSFLLFLSFLLLFSVFKKFVELVLWSDLAE
jgi:hypothetical protein